MSGNTASPDCIYHYTGQAGLLGILREQVIHATDLRFVNDRTEYQHALAIALRQLAKLENGHKEIVGYFRDLLHEGTEPMAGAVYIAAFSERGDDLNQWRAYSAGGAGFCIGFDPVALCQVAPRHCHLSKCIYDEPSTTLQIDMVIDRMLEELTGREWPLDEFYIAEKLGDWFFDELAEVAPLLKNHAFRDEDEWRLWQTHAEDALFWRPGTHAPVPFIRVPHSFSEVRSIVSVRIGPTADPHLARLAVAGLLEHAYGAEHGIDVAISEVPYRG